jgi:diacylglycerol kinase family enzyme
MTSTGPASGRPATPGAGPGSRPPTSNDRVAVVVNGNAKSVSDEVIETLDSILDQGDLFVSRRIEDSEAIARTLVDRGYGTILTGGGDGTFTVVVTAIVREAERRNLPLPRFGLLRLGTGNSLAWLLGSSRTGKGRTTRALEVDIARLRNDAGSRELRLVEVDGMLAPFCGFGVDAIGLRDYHATRRFLSRGPLRKLAAGALGYAVSATTRTIPGYLLRRTPHCRVVNRGGDAFRIGPKGSRLGAAIPAGALLYEGPAMMCSVGTIPYYGFGFRVFPYALDRDDRMQLRVSNIGSIPFVMNASAIWNGEYENLELLHDYFVEAVEIEMDPPTPFQIGGDEAGERERVNVRLARPIRIVDFYAPPRG